MLVVADALIEFIWSIAWGFLCCFSEGIFIFYPESSWLNRNTVFFLFLLVWYELKSDSVCNPAFWVKDYVSDSISTKPRDKQLLRRELLFMTGVDCLAQVIGVWGYLGVLSIMGPEFFAKGNLPPSYHSCSLLFACGVEFILTFGTLVVQFVALFRQARMRNLCSSLVTLGLLMWGEFYTQAIMDPANGLARVFFAFPSEWIKLLLVFCVSPMLAGVCVGILQGRMERRRIKSEKFD